MAGGAGFLGSHLVDELISLNHEVIVVDNLYTGSKSNISHHLLNPKFEFIRHDVTIPLYVECDFIFNLASPRPLFNIKSIPYKQSRPTFWDQSICWD